MSIEVEYSDMLCLCFSFCRSLEGLQVRGPKAVEQLADDLEPIRTQREQVPRPLAAFGEQACAAQDLQVVRNGLLGHADGLGNFADGARLVAHNTKNAPPSGVG
jgi:hypothetical protein